MAFVSGQPFAISCSTDNDSRKLFPDIRCIYLYAYHREWFHYEQGHIPGLIFAWGITPTLPEPSQGPLSIQIPIDYDALDLEDVSASQNAMRSTFGCLSFERYSANEKEMHCHERFDVESTL
ncbi:hypothetical protein TESG_08368 [Trichophyton tonsurans CBS 112818]|uniref:Uncharacterized protein n=1 Tax=Trichophyton tonsurans (strain CBS 112818) TaxID=647933 RepID=F2RUQ1_TRIT1|nr:hypothetical protein TESG_08368 [Trichophyton tonsurans CBS 112818]